MAYRLEPVASNLSEHLDLTRLRTRLREKPRTKVGQVRQAWPDIRDLLAAGHSLKDIWAWLNEIGLEIGYARLSHYIGQLRRRDESSQSQTPDLRRWMVSAAIESEGQTTAQEQLLEDAPAGQAQPLQDLTYDPLRNVREQRARKRGFEYNPFPTKGLTR